MEALSQRSHGLRAHDSLSGLEWGCMDKRRGKGIADSGKAFEATLARAFSGYTLTGKHRGQHPSNIGKPDPTAFVHAAHPPYQLSCTRESMRLA